MDGDTIGMILGLWSDGDDWSWKRSFTYYQVLQMATRNPNHQLIGGKHPMIYRVSTIRTWWCRISSIHHSFTIIQWKFDEGKNDPVGF